MTTEIIQNKFYNKLASQYPEVFKALEGLGIATHSAGPIGAKEAQLIQLAAAAASQSEGGVHSHVKRARELGATSEEIKHALLLLVSTIGLPRTAAAISWCEDVLAE